MVSKPQIVPKINARGLTKKDHRQKVCEHLEGVRNADIGCRVGF